MAEVGVRTVQVSSKAISAWLSRVGIVPRDSIAVGAVWDFNSEGLRLKFVSSEFSPLPERAAVPNIAVIDEDGVTYATR